MRAALKELIARTSAARFASGARHARTIVAFTRQRTPACFASHSRSGADAVEAPRSRSDARDAEDTRSEGVAGRVGPGAGPVW